MTEELRTSDEELREVDLTTEQAERAERLYHDIWSDTDAHDAAREIIYLRDRVRALEVACTPRRDESTIDWVQRIEQTVRP